MVFHAEGGSKSANRPDEGDSGELLDSIAQMVKGKNINQSSFLATDYLNHFNDVIMLFDLLPTMPECLGDVLEWEPMSYAEHFRQSGLSDRELAILAYNNAPEAFRDPFDRVVSAMDRLILEGRQDIVRIMEPPDSGQLDTLATELTGELRRHIEIASAIINGKSTALDESLADASNQSPDQSEISPKGQTPQANGQGLTQNDIDALFD